MSLEIVMGPMFAGKTSYALRLVRKYTAQGLRVFVIKPSIDVRYTALSEIITHNGDSLPCYTTDTLDTITPDMLEPFSVIIVDEAQFFTNLVSFAKLAVDTMSRTVCFVGLSGDANRRPFGEFLTLIPLADTITHLSSLCACGKKAHFTRRLADGHEQIAVGGPEMYVPQCRYCYVYK